MREKRRATCVALACVTLLAGTASAHAAGTVFADFNANEGIFNQTPDYSGTSNILATSTAARTTATGERREGAGAEKLVLNAGTAATQRCRFVANAGGPTGQSSITVSSGTSDGYIGFFYRVIGPTNGLRFGINLDSPSNAAADMTGAVLKTAADDDGEWHLVEWNLDDLGDWGPVPAINGSAAMLENAAKQPKTIDSIYFYSVAPDSVTTVIIDYVAHNPNGSVANLLEDPCINVPAVGGVNGPLSAGQESVTVRGVNASATAVTVFADGVQIGQLTTGIAAGDNIVPTSPLIKGKHLQATQTIGGQPSCQPNPGTGPIVGGGPTPSIKVSLSVRETLTLTGPIGEPTSGTGLGSVLYLIPATGRTGAVVNSPQLQPRKYWQTFSALRGTDEGAPVDSVILWNGTDANGQLNGNFGLLDAIWISIDSPDTGPYRIYIDELRNGNTLINGWELGNIMFSQPSYSSTTSGSLLLDGPTEWLNSRVVSTSYADRDTHSLRVSWQFSAESGAGLRLLSNLAPDYPQVDLRLPISARFLVLPVGEVPGARPEIQVHPADVTTSNSGSAVFTVQATGTGTLSYDWLVNGRPTVDTEDDGDPAKLTLKNLMHIESWEPASYEANKYTVSVAVRNEEGSVHSDIAMLTISGCNTPLPDLDGDTDVDMDDFGTLQGCIDPTGLPAGCLCADFNSDTIVDQQDLLKFQACASGASIPQANANCAD